LLVFHLVLIGLTPFAGAQRKTPVAGMSGIDDVVFSICFSPDGRTLAIARGAAEPVYRFGRIELWDTNSGKLRHVIKGFDGPVMSVSFTPDGQTLISGSIEFRPLELQQKANSREGQSFGEVRWWNAGTGELQNRLTLPRDNSFSIRAIHSPFGQHLAVTLFFGHRIFLPRLESSSMGNFPELPWGIPFLEVQTRLVNARTGEPGPKLDVGQPGPTTFSPDGKLLAVANAKAVRLVDSETGEPVLKIKDFRGTVTGIAFSTGGNILAVASTRYEERDAPGNRVEIFGISEVQLFDVASGLSTRTLKDIGAVNSMAFSPDGRLLVLGGMLPEEEGGSAGLKFYDLGTLKSANLRTGEDYKEQVGPLTISGDGKLLAFRSGPTTVKLLNTLTGVVTYIFDQDSVGDAAERPANRFQVFVKRVVAVAFSTDGTLLTGESDQGEIKTWDARTGEVKQELVDEQDEPSLVTASADGKSLAEFTKGQLFFWSADSGSKRAVPLADGKSVTALALTADGRMLALSRGSKVTLLSPNGAVENELPVQEGVVNRLAFSRDGRLLAGADQFGNVNLWDAHTGRLEKKWATQAEITSFAFSVKGLLLATAAPDKTISIWNVQTGTALQKFHKHSDTINALEFSPDDRLLASGSDDRTIVLWEVATGKSKHTFKRHDQTVTSLAFSPDGRRLASGTGNASVVIWELRTGKLDRVLK